MMRRHQIESAVTTSSRIIPIPAPSQEVEFINGSNSCSSLTPAGGISESVMISPPSPCDTPPRKRWEGAYKVFLRKKSPQNSPTLSTSPSSSVASIPVVEDLSTGTGTSGSTGGGVGGTIKGAKKKSSFSLIPGSKRLVSRYGGPKVKNSSLSSMFSKSGSFSRSHTSMDALDVPLRNGITRSRASAGSNPNSASPTGYVLNMEERSSPLTIQSQLQSSLQGGTANGSLSGSNFRREQEELYDQAIASSILSKTPPPATSALNAQLRACAVSSASSYGQQHTPNEPLEATHSEGGNTNQITNAGIDLLDGMSSTPSLTQLHHRPSQSRTFIYSSNSNSSTPVHQSQRSQSHQDELDFRMVPVMPSLKGIGMHQRGSCQSSQSSFDDVGLNLDESDNSHVGDSNHTRQDQLQSNLDEQRNDPNKCQDSGSSNGKTTIITDCGVPEPPESLDEILGNCIGGLVTVHSSSSSHLLSRMEQPIVASPDTRKAFTKIHNSSEYGQDISPFLGGNKASNRDLAGAYKSCIATQRSMLLRSMDSDGKINVNTITQSRSLEGEHMMEGNHHSPPSFLSPPFRLDTNSEQNPAKDLRLLKPIQSADFWVQGRRYLIAPAALAACPLSTIKSLTGLSTRTATEAALSADPPMASGVIELGEASMTYFGEKYHLSNGRWSTCILVLRQNYLFEYDLSTPLNGAPRGIAHLGHAVAETHHDFEDALQLHYYASPCAKVDHRTLFIRVKNKDERDHWITCLNRAASLRIEDIWEYKKDRSLGKGRYASIYPAQRRKSKATDDEDEHRCDHDNDDNNCALKIIDKNEFWRLVAKGRERCDTIVRELAVQSTLTAKFGSKTSFLKIHGFFETSQNVVIELELLDGRDLFEYISSKGVIEEEEAAFIIRDVLVALNCMSLAGIAHRDIKPANILITRRDESEYGTSVKLADFGMSTLVGVDGLVRGRCGSPGYVAPEILKADAGEGYRNQVDVFSAGVTLYLMLCGYEPFYGETEKELINANKSAVVDFSDNEWCKISAEAKDLVARMLKTNPAERITAKEAVEHPWIARLEQTEKRNCMFHRESADNIVFHDADLGEGVCAIT